jgi:hypothetical protein
MVALMLLLLSLSRVPSMLAGAAVVSHRGDPLVFTRAGVTPDFYAARDLVLEQSERLARIEAALPHGNRRPPPASEVTCRRESWRSG